LASIAHGEITIADFHPARSDMRADVLEGLSNPDQKSISSKYFYDARGSRLFDRITELDEYYPTRTEMAIFDACEHEIAESVGPHATVIEFGSGSSLKIDRLLTLLDKPVAYVPIEISRSHLIQTAVEVQNTHDLEVLPVCADFMGDYQIPTPQAESDRKLIFFPGSTIGNFDPEEALDLLRRMARIVAEPDDAAIVGIDLQKPLDILLPAYDDAEGVTAEFNRNLLRRINRELDADFDPRAFEHEARYSQTEQRIEMHLVSRAEQTVHVAGREFRFARGETIHTENSHKHTPEGFASLAAKAGLRVEHLWHDPRRLFAVTLLRRA